jgi:hypothetical protein
MKNRFENVVASTQDIRFCHEKKLRALGKYSNKISLGKPSHCDGSVFIDKCLERQNISSAGNRWDYCFSYMNEVYFIEVHPAKTDQVSVMLKKLEWLKGWLRDRAPELDRMKARNRTPYYWIQHAGFHIRGSQARRIIDKGLKPIPILRLP